ncbi:unnamed protein product [Acanthoscelides obtectus]|uniref:Large subunit GTPase 1 homolog n=1 Tax=Acanthoscelides obtectus TaxID=200917 RepID=A0A9P0Q4L9_ACAOB|nr:unnamed protein product [Acanthoscelides obtectus]CAK1623121.1 Large subunit GTPase 1 homolog [Acanthoscelides obtectus]
MPKKKASGQSSALGRSLIKDRFGGNKNRKMVSDNSMLHTTEVQDGYDWGRLNLQSVTEESSFQEFLSTAELAGTEFEAEKLHIKCIHPNTKVGLLTKEKYAAVRLDHEKYKGSLKIPRRPKWNNSTTPEELDRNEKKHFLEWRRALAQLQEDHELMLTPYEKNLEFWRQLWRVVERSDVVVQIVDARNPLLFYCEDLEKYVTEVSKDKVNLLILNKADYLTKKQRETWAKYFSSVGKRMVFFSARLETEKETKSKDTENPESETSNQINNDSKDVENGKVDDEGNSQNAETARMCIETLQNAVEQNASALNEIINKIESVIGKAQLSEEVCQIHNSPDLIDKETIVELFRTIHTGTKVMQGVTTIGLIGYPNVGKSSTINSLLTIKKLAVSATPGKTKHFQTLYLDKDLVLCDCPGLVMPSFVFTKADMIINGILPIDQMKDYIPSINVITTSFPRNILEAQYGISLPTPQDGKGPGTSPTAEEFLNAYAYSRGYMTANGQPDMARAARYILKDYLNGELLYCHAPPGIDQEFYSSVTNRKVKAKKAAPTPHSMRATRGCSRNRKTLEEIKQA